MESGTIQTLIQGISTLISPLGYEVVHLEAQTQRGRVLRLFIDFKEGAGKTIGIEDCATVSRAIDEPLDQLVDQTGVFSGASYELEVSSPGIDRPLRTPRDYERFTGKNVRVHVFRPLTAEEIGNTAFQAKNPKQKNFVGILEGREGSPGEDKIRIALDPASGPAGTVTIPLALVSKANLEPQFEKASKA
jgi:ribosome maturation factor RimP